MASTASRERELAFAIGRELGALARQLADVRDSLAEMSDRLEATRRLLEGPAPESILDRAARNPRLHRRFAQREAAARKVFEDRLETWLNSPSAETYRRSRHAQRLAFRADPRVGLGLGPLRRPESSLDRAAAASAVIGGPGMRDTLS